MIINKSGATFEYEGLIYMIGAEIVGTPASEYQGLYGIITEIRDGSDKETDNETPEIYCSFEPPVLPYEIKMLEGVFSRLYSAPKTIDDITLDCVVLAPEMVRPLESLDSYRAQMPVYLVKEDWAINGEAGSSCAIFADYDDAKRVLYTTILDERNSGCIAQWAGSENYVEDSSKDSFDGYLDEDFLDNHYSVCIVKQLVRLPARFACKGEDIIKLAEGGN